MPSEIAWRDAKIDKLTFELAQLKRLKFGASSEQFDAEQRALFDEAVDADIAAIEEQLEGSSRPRCRPRRRATKKQPEAHARCRRSCRASTCTTNPRPRPAPAAARMKRIGEDVSEKLDYTPGVFTVERHVRGKWACCAVPDADPGAGAGRRSSTRASRPPGCWRRCWWPSTPTTCRCIARKRSSAAPAWRSRARRWRAGSASAACGCSRWSMRSRPSCCSCQVLHADETPVAMLAPGKGKTHRAYLWAYAAAPSSRSRPWSTTSPTAALANMPGPSSA